MNPAIEPAAIRHILVLGSIGIGNLLLFSPALRQLRRHYPNARICIIVLSPIFKALYEGEPDVDEVMVIHPGRDKTPGKIWHILRALRQTPWDLAVTTFPANRLEYNVLPWLAGARYRIAHQYDTKQWSTLGFLQNIRVPVNPALHDVEQNNALLGPLGIEPPAEPELICTIPETARHQAEQYTDDQGLSDAACIGVHPGSSAARGMDYKRWPVEQFAACLRKIIDKHPMRVLIFGGPDEEPLKQALAGHVGAAALVVDCMPLKTTAALLQRCRCFLTNDSGLMHVAVAMGVQTFALFGPSDPGRTRPWGERHTVLSKGMACSPCWSIRNLGVGRVPCIYDKNKCMLELTGEHAADQILQHLAAVESGQERHHGI